MARLQWAASFHKALRKLSPDARQAALDALEKLLENPPRPSLNLESLRGKPGYWSIRVNRSWRILLRRQSDELGELYVAVDVGPHDIYRRL